MLLPAGVSALDLLREDGEGRSPLVEGSVESPGPGDYPPEMEMESKPDDQLYMTVDQEIANMVVSNQLASENFRRQKRENWDKCWDHMLQVYDDTNKEPWQSKRFWPETPKVVETILANFHGAILTPKVPIEWQCKVKEHEEHVSATNDIVQNDFNQSGFKLALTDILREMCILGTGVGKVEYEKKEGVVPVKKRKRPGLVMRSVASFLGLPEPKEDFEFVEEKKVLRDWAKINYVDLYKIYPEPYSTKICKENWIIEEREISNAELIELANHPDENYRLENVTEELLSFGGEDKRLNDPELQQKRADLNQPAISLNTTDPGKRHKLLEYFGPAPLWMVDESAYGDPSRKYESVNAWFWVVDDKHVVLKRRNPNLDGEPPYFKLPYLQIPGDWYGIGPAEMIIHLQIEKNELVNTALDNVNLILNKILAVNKDKVMKGGWDRLVSKPGAVWLFENVDDIKKAMAPVEFNNLLRDVYMAIDLVDRAIQETTGAVKATIGVGGAEDEAGGGTFRGQLMNKQVASERFMLYARTLESGGLSDCWRKFYSRIYQFKTFDGLVRILGQNRIKTFDFMSPEDLDLAADLVPLGVMTLETKAVKVAQMGEFDANYMNEPWFKRRKMAQRRWTELGFSDPDTVIMSDDEMKQFNAIKRSLMGGQGGGMPPMGAGPGSPQGQPIGGPNVEQNPAVNPDLQGVPGVGQADMTGSPLG